MAAVSDEDAPALSSEHVKWRRPRSQLSHLISETDPPIPIPTPQIQSTRCKSTISSLLLSTFSNNTSTETPLPNINNNNKKKKKNNFAPASFRGFGCSAGASQQVSVPAVIRTSADWRGTKARKKKHKRNGSNFVDGSNSSGSANFVDFQDVWCGPGIGFSADVAAAAPVDCVTARKNVSATRGRIDVEKITHKERRRTVNPESVPFLNSDTDIFTNRSESLAAARYYRHVPHPSSDGFTEIMLLQGSLLMGGRLNSHDYYRDWRLDVDNMSYEQLLALGERIGYVNTGLKEDEIRRYTRKFKFSKLIKTSEQHVDKNCSICQEEYAADDDLGRLKCEHSYHFQCLKQWLAQKNSCPVCKQEVVLRHSVAKSSKF